MILFQEIIETIEGLPVKDQDYLFEMIQKRRVATQKNLSMPVSAQTLNPPNKFTFDYTALPIWEVVAKLSAQVPDEEWQKLPTDLAMNFDDYQRDRLSKN
jgi:type I restriction enzyme S subunit